ncbi:chromatin assembly factor 1 subunit A-B-like [Chenopodium quinoa]|uniref:chromatin assembly factor 1 subunit A-B-like n=1 Tax=Chenopodium quinoa TaxID=63459 RepID=UPI000B7740BE|nr:chromatin assembly factor 1 subunit A-B-like [Chenopodium quinoa]
MGKNVILTTILVILVVADVSNAAFLRNFRRLAATPPIEDPNKPGTPIPSPVVPGSHSSSVDGEEKSKEKKQIGPPPATTAGKDASKDKQMTNDTHKTPVTPPIGAKEHNNTSKEAVKDKEKEEEKKEEEKEKAEEKEEDKKEKEEEQKEKGEEKNKEEPKEKAESKPAAPVGSSESCDEIGRRCQDLKSMTACVKSFDSDSKALVLLIQNKGDISLKVDVSAMSSGSKQKVITVPKLKSKQMEMSLADGGINEITLNAGYGNCVLHVGTPASQGNYFQLLPSYSKFMTPTYGAYLVLVITLIAGGVLGCCWFCKRKAQRDIPYQELELSMPESAVAAETVEGWDEVWDDDWDEENAVRSPGGHRISANGLTARNSKKDDWEDWDD